MIPLQGEHICRVDAKGRFMLPVALRSQLHAVLKEGFVIKRSINNVCLELFPKSNWDETFNKITSALKMFRKKDQDFIRAYKTGLNGLEIDNTGRILIPRDLAMFAKITGDIVVSAQTGRIEIWDKAEFDKAINETLSNMEELNEELLGDITFN